MITILLPSPHFWSLKFRVLIFRMIFLFLVSCRILTLRRRLLMLLLSLVVVYRTRIVPISNSFFKKRLIRFTVIRMDCIYPVNALMDSGTTPMTMTMILITTMLVLLALLLLRRRIRHPSILRRSYKERRRGRRRRTVDDQTIPDPNGIFISTPICRECVNGVPMMMRS